MQGCELGNRGAVRMRNSALTPGIQALMAQAELRAQEGRPNLVDELAMRMSISGHAALYQRPVDTSSPQTLIGSNHPLLHTTGMDFPTRLRQAISQSRKHKNARQLALALGWSAQRIDNYLKLHDGKERIPDRKSLALLAAELETTPEALLNETTDDGMKDILLALLAIEGISPDRADMLASAAIEAKRLLDNTIDDAPTPTRARFAANLVWQQQFSQ